MTKQEFIEEYEHLFKQLLMYYGKDRIRNKIHENVSIIAGLAREKLHYSDGTKIVFITNTLYQQYLKQADLSGAYVNRVSEDKKMIFVNKHIIKFEALRSTVQNNVLFTGNHGIIKTIAELARKELNYSDKTAPIDIVRHLYDLYIKEYH